LRGISRLFLICLFHSTWALGAGLRAQWLDANHISFKLSPGTYISNSTQFFLVDSALSVKSGTAILLPLLGLKDNVALLDSSMLSRSDVNRLLRQALKVVITTSNRQILETSALQLAGILDELYYYNGPDLGGDCRGAQCSLKLWAPTAQRVRVFIFSRADTPLDQAQILNLNDGPQGVWSLTLPGEFKNSYYLYEVQVYNPLTDKIETSLVTDPYSKSLSMNGWRSQLVDLQDPTLTPPSWDSLRKPVLNNLKDAVIYELHIRDFSVTDSTVVESLRGTYLAFTQKNSAGMSHLRSLAEAGLTHVHLLPFNDFGSVNEDKTTWENYDGSNSNLQEPQSILSGIRASDPFNWGYDPVHYFAPEGSYSTHPQSATRIFEVRKMVQSLNEAGLRVIQDVVFNHTYENALHPMSIFDKVVPQYYYRLDDEGQVQRSSCCYDTASEHRMMEKLMIDSVLHWARAYKIDGFRFDLMSFHSRATLDRLRQALRGLTLAKDGVDGAKILLYGEGWSFGSYYWSHPTEAMTLESSYGTGYGFFNDRLRDAVRGGTTNSAEIADQGFATGLFFDFNSEPANRNTPLRLEEQKEKLLHLGDVIKGGLAGNLRDYRLKEHLGSTIRLGELRFRNAPVGVAAQALETVNYVAGHDGYGLWDAIQAKSPFYTSGRTPPTAALEDRQRMHQLALAIPLLGQGIPFIEAGTELLRSKNGDQDSYDSGDFFNRIEWNGSTNFWGRALPPAWKNISDWPFWQPRLQESALQVTPEAIAKTRNYFLALLRLRKSSPLFHLNTLDEISRQVSFIDNQTQAEPGLIAMYLKGSAESLLVFFNASREDRIFTHPLLQEPWTLHPLLDPQVDPVLSAVSVDAVGGRIRLPGRSTVVLKALSALRGSR